MGRRAVLHDAATTMLPRSEEVEQVTDAENDELEPPPEDDWGDAATDGEPDVLLDVSELRVEEISVEVEDLRARVSLEADVLQLLKLHVGVEAELGRVSLTIKGVDAKALLKVRLDNVARILDRVLTTIDNHPDIVEQLLEHVGEGVEEVGTGAGQAVGEVGAGAGSAVEDVGGGVGEVGRGARRVVEDVGGAVGEVGRDAGRVVEDVGEDAGQAEGDVGEDAGARRPTEGAPERRRRRTADSPGMRPAKGSRASRARRSKGD
jgi:hypothetical protein